MTDTTNRAAPIVFEMTSASILGKLTLNERLSVFDAIVSEIAKGRQPVVRVTGSLSVQKVLKSFVADSETSQLGKQLGLSPNATRADVATMALASI